jgi:hypothetical protein
MHLRLATVMRIVSDSRYDTESKTVLRYYIAGISFLIVSIFSFAAWY